MECEDPWHRDSVIINCTIPDKPSTSERVVDEHNYFTDLLNEKWPQKLDIPIHIKMNLMKADNKWIS